MRHRARKSWHRLTLEPLEARTLLAVGLTVPGAFATVQADVSALSAPVTPIDASGGNHSRDTADLLAVPQTSVRGSLAPAAPTEWFRLVVDQPGTLTADLQPGLPAVGLRLTLTDAAGTVLATSEGLSGNPLGGQLVQHVGPGTYYLAATAPAGSASYTLRTELAPASSPLDPVATGKNPQALAWGDFNRDGHFDLVTANAGDDTLTVLLGRGDGTFRPAITLSTGDGLDEDQPIALAVADLDRDGVLDLVCANAFSGTLGVFRGNGDGTFALRDRLPMGGEPSAVAVGDVDGDNRLDLIATDRSGGTVVVWRNTTSGFVADVPLAVGFEPVAVAVADVLGDGHLDLIAASYQDARVTILPGAGHGRFGAAKVYTVGDGPTALAVADVTGDGRLDVLTANRVGNSVSVLRSRATGGLDVLPPLAAGLQPVALAVGDVTGDQVPDLAVATASDTLQLFRGVGNGTFTYQQEHAPGGAQTAVTLVDLTGDDKLDLAAAIGPANQFALLFGNGDGSFLARERFVVGPEPVGVAVDDFDLDGRRDVVTADASADTLTLLLGNGDGTFQPQRQAAAGVRPVAVATGDFNRDGRPDLVSANRLGDASGTLTVLLGNGVGGFLPVGEYPVGSETVAVIAADLDRDGILDLVAANRGDDTLSILLGKGDGTFNSALTLPTGRNPFAVVAADVDGDGLVDLAAANRRSHSVSVYHGFGNGKFAPRQNFAVGSYPAALAVGDLTRDGLPDLVTANQANTVTVLRGLPGGGFERLLPDLNVGGQPIGVLIADFDGDRLLDVMTADSGGGTVSVLRGNADGTFQTRFAVPVGQGPAFLAADDLNGDGRLDVVTPNARESTIGVLLGPFADATTAIPATPLRESAVPTTPFLHDFNGDGRLDSVILDRTGQILYRQGRPTDDLPLGPYQVLNPGRPARDLVPVRTGDGWAIAALDAGTACTVTLYRAPTDGQLAPPADLFSLGVLALRITAGDLSGTGRDSLILSHPLAAGVSIALPGAATASFQEPQFHSTGANPTEVTLADLDGDHDLDVLVNATASGDLTVLDNDPNQHFDTVRRFRSGTAAYGLERGQVESLQQPVAAVAGDFLPGGGTDVVVLHQGLHALVTLVNNGRGGLLNPQLDHLSSTTVDGTLLDAPGPMVTGYFDGDRLLDLAVLDRGRGQVLIFLGRGDGTFRFISTAPAGDTPLGLTVFDNPVTRQRDLLVGNAAGDIRRLAGHGDGTFDPPPPFTGDRTSLSVVVSGGKPTVVVANQLANRVTVQTPTAGGNRYLIASALATPPNLKAVGAVTSAQLDGYGALERIVVGTGSNNVVVYGRNGAVAFPVGNRPVAVTVADLNADSVPDLVVTNQGSNNVSVLFGRLTASGWTAAFTNTVPSGGFGPLGTIVRDTDRDGRPDLVITNSASAAGSQTGSVTVIPAAGLGFFRPVSVSIPLPSTPTGPFPPGPTTVTPDTNGRLIGLDLVSLSSLGVVYQGSAAVSAVAGVGGRVVVVLANGRVDLLQPNDQGTFSVAGELVGLNGLPSDPSALAVLETESGIQVLVTASGSDQLFVFELPSAAGAGNPGGPGEVAVVAETSALDGESLVVVVTLLAGGLAEGNNLASVVAPAEDDAPTIPIAAEAMEGQEQVAEGTAATEAAAVGPEGPAPEIQLGPPVEEDPFAPGPPSAVEEDEASAPAASDVAEEVVVAPDEAAPPLAVTGSETPAADADLEANDAAAEAPADAATPLPGAGSEADVLPALTAVALGWAAGYVVADRQPDEKIVKSSLDPRPRLRQHG